MSEWGSMRSEDYTLCQHCKFPITRLEYSETWKAEDVWAHRNTGAIHFRGHEATPYVSEGVLYTWDAIHIWDNE